MPLSALTGTRLRERRLAAGLRQADVARRCGDFGLVPQPDRAQPPQGGGASA